MFRSTRIRFTFCLIALFGALFIAGCSVFSGPATPTAVPVTPTAKPTRTPIPSATPTATTTPTRTPVPSSTPTVTPTVIAELKDAKFYTAGYLPAWKYFFAVQAPEPIQGNYYALVQNNKEYTCEVQAAYPNRLYCTGRQAVMADYVSYVIYDQVSGSPVMEGEFFIPLKVLGE